MSEPLPSWVIFLRERFDEDAVLATMREIHKRDCDNIPQAGSEYTYPCDCGVPERMQREVTAKRAILDHYLKNAGIEPEDWPGMVDPEATNAELLDLHHIMDIYKEHPAYSTALAALKEDYWTP